MPTEVAPKVFISYSTDSPLHADAVLGLANRLRAEGIDCSIDQYEESPPEGWPQWMEKQIRESEFVLVVCSEFYLKKMHGQVQPNEGLGVRWEGKLLYQILYNEGANTKFVPVLLDNGKPEHIPTPLQGATHYRPSQKGDYDRLYWRLRGEPLRNKPPLGQLKPLPPKPRKTNPGLFLTGFIDLSLWGPAGWKAVFYICDKVQPPWLGLVFKGEEQARNIFEQWHQRLGRNDAYEEMRVSVVEGDIPGEDPGYTVYISANINNILRRADDMGLNFPNEHVAVVGRMLRMNPSPGSKNLEMFKEAYQHFGCYQLCPAILTPEGVKVLPGYGLLKKEINLRHVSEIKSKNDIDSAVLGKPSSSEAEPAAQT
jgi:SEFIR domain